MPSKREITKRLREDPGALSTYFALIEVAMDRGTTTYGALAERIGLPRRGPHMARELGRLLELISLYETQHARPLLSVVVFSTTDKKPGRGFFALARSLGLLAEDEDEDAFYRHQLGAVYHTWS